LSPIGPVHVSDHHGRFGFITFSSCDAGKIYENRACKKKPAAERPEFDVRIFFCGRFVAIIAFSSEVDRGSRKDENLQSPVLIQSEPMRL